jgi:serine O-acetyltransferase
MTLRMVFQYIYSDYRRVVSYYGMDGSFMLLRFLSACFTHSLLAMFFHRWSFYFFSKKNALARFIARLIYFFNQMITGLEIGPRSFVGSGCLILHPTGSVILGRIGERCTIYGQAGIGINPDKLQDVGAGPGLPWIGDDCVLGLGSKVIGPVRVGDRAVVGAAALVIDDVPADAVVGGVPARVISMKEPRHE